MEGYKKMVVAPWLQFKTKEGKKLCIRFLEFDLFCDGMNCDMIAQDNNITVDNVYQLTENELKNLAQVQKKRGRPLKNGYMQRSVETKVFLREKNADCFKLLDNKEQTPEILSNNDLYIDNLLETVEIVKNDFFNDNPELIKKHPSIWFRRLCLTIKQNTPRMLYTDNPEIISRVWDVYSDLCLYVGINRTIENFQIFSGLKWSVIDKIKEGASPAWASVSKKIYSSCKADIVGGLASSFGSSPNQMFIAKSIYGIVENTVVTHVSATNSTKNIDDIPLFLENKVDQV